MNGLPTFDTVRVLRDDVIVERIRQDAKFPNQTLPNGTSAARWLEHADRFRNVTNAAAESGELTWLDILLEETFEAACEEDEARLRAELVQVAAVAVRWIEDIDEREV